MSNGKYDEKIQEIRQTTTNNAERIDQQVLDEDVMVYEIAAALSDLTGAVPISLLRVGNELARIADALEAVTATAERVANPARFVAGLALIEERS